MISSSTILNLTDTVKESADSFAKNLPVQNRIGSENKYDDISQKRFNESSNDSFVKSELSGNDNYAAILKKTADKGRTGGYKTETDNKEQNSENANNKKTAADNELTDAEKKQVENLKKTDQKVRAHEQAHKSAGGGLTRGGAQYSFTTGPDGKKYAVGGEVKIDMSEIPGDPEATVRKMQIVKRAALAPADPSPQDRQVASRAATIEAQARREMMKMNTAENSTGKYTSQTTKKSSNENVLVSKYSETANSKNNSPQHFDSINSTGIESLNRAHK